MPSHRAGFSLPSASKGIIEAVGAPVVTKGTWAEAGAGLLGFLAQTNWIGTWSVSSRCWASCQHLGSRSVRIGAKPLKAMRASKRSRAVPPMSNRILVMLRTESPVISYTLTQLPDANMMAY